MRVTPARIDRYLGTVERGLRSLFGLAMSRGATASESDEALADRLAFQDEWWDLMDRLDTLSAAYARGDLTEAQTLEFEALCPPFLDAVPIIQTLGLRPPPASTIETAHHLARTAIAVPGAPGTDSHRRTRRTWHGQPSSRQAQPDEGHLKA